MGEDGDSSDVLLQKLHDETRHNFARMFLHHNEHGVKCTLMLETLKGAKPLFGEYSDMTPYIDHTLDAVDASILSSASINGNMRNSFLIKKLQITQNGNAFDQQQPKAGLFDSFGGLFGKKKQQQNQGGLGALG